MDAPTTEITISAELEADLADLVKASRMLELLGHSDRIWGHVAMRDPEGRGFWIKRHAISFGEVFDSSDFQLTAFDGTPLAGEGRCHSEWPVHGEIMQLRPDINYTAHSHPFYGSIYSAVHEPLRYVRGNSPSGPPRYEGSSELVTDRDAGHQVAKAMGGAAQVFMRNHGVVFSGASAVELVKNGHDLEEKCHQMLVVSGANLDWSAPSAEEEARKNSSGAAASRFDALWAHYCRYLERAEAQGDPRLSYAPIEKM
jgi:L-fuculose-phosphate aldolase